MDIFALGPRQTFSLETSLVSSLFWSKLKQTKSVFNTHSRHGMAATHLCRTCQTNLAMQYLIIIASHYHSRQKLVNRNSSFYKYQGKTNTQILIIAKKSQLFSKTYHIRMEAKVWYGHGSAFPLFIPVKRKVVELLYQSLPAKSEFDLREILSLQQNSMILIY